MEPKVKLGAALGLLVLVVGCAGPGPQVGVRFEAEGHTLAAGAKAHVSLWSAPAGSSEAGTLVVQDEVGLTSLPATLSLTVPAAPWGVRLAYWLEAEVDADGDGSLGTGDWVLAPRPPVTDLSTLGQNPQWQHPQGAAAGPLP